MLSESTNPRRETLRSEIKGGKNETKFEKTKREKKTHILSKRFTSSTQPSQPNTVGAVWFAEKLSQAHTLLVSAV